ncbi:hypothetical protein BG55_20755 [Erwinia mallotivora]|uniref:Uncharacterized protein n=1 Tax=Erwinia mallotivora TaxID=69222 RepID=A0A014PRZ7_9GAMM|nr:hypothetical protein BG55_20755 [Erwinia mallotivora]
MICFDLAIDQIAQSGLSSLKVIYYSAQLFSGRYQNPASPDESDWHGHDCIPAPGHYHNNRNFAGKPLATTGLAVRSATTLSAR